MSRFKVHYYLKSTVILNFLKKNSNLFFPEHPSEVHSRLYIHSGKNSIVQTLDQYVLGNAIVGWSSVMAMDGFGSSK